uniref:Uncharacterized protein n=1 Tax=Romanomermis culicivorax TaxID=13658 RepID=A0A915HWT4_ROMCU
MKLLELDDRKLGDMSQSHPPIIVQQLYYNKIYWRYFGRHRHQRLKKCPHCRRGPLTRPEQNQSDDVRDQEIVSKEYKITLIFQ